MVIRDESVKWGGALEVLAACRQDGKAGADKGHMFTGALSELLKDEAITHDGATAFGLGTIMSNRKWWKDTKELKTDPVYVDVGTSLKATARPSRTVSFITLIPMEKAGDDSSSALSALTLSEAVPYTDARILISVSLETPPKPEEWIAMFEHYRPGGVHGLKFAAWSEKDLSSLKINNIALFESGSSLAIMSIPIWLWYALPPNDAYQRIGTVYSDNLLKTVQVDAGTQTKASVKL
jgi:hypothetical protein